MSATTSRATLADVARRAGVSVQTVSNALNSPEKLKPSTRERVLKAVDALGYRPNRSARALRTASARTIGLRLQAPLGQGTSFQDRFLHALAEFARAKDYLLVVFATDLDDEICSYGDLVNSGTVDSFVLTDTSAGDRRPETLTGLGVPFVAFGRPWGVPTPTRHSWVDVDGAAGGELAVTHLLERGRRHVAMLGWPEGSDTGDDRWRGWERGLLAAGATAGPVGRCANDVDDAAEATYALFRAHPDIDAIFCVSDTVAAGVYRAFAHLGIQVGKQVSVVGFDDGPSAALMPVPLTTITQPVEKVAATVIDMLENQRTSSTFEPQTIVLTPSLTVRESS